MTGQIKTCLVSEHSGRVGRVYHAERNAILLQMIIIYVEKATVIKTHLNHDEHVEAIEKGRHYLVEA